MTLTPREIDKRLVRRQLERGRIDEKAYKKYIEGLPDCSDMVAPQEDPRSEGDAQG